MNAVTKEFLTECRKAGYEKVTINAVDKRVPASTKIELYGQRKYNTTVNSGGIFSHGRELCFVAGEPEVLDGSRPAIWTICEKNPCTAELGWARGFGCGHAHSINKNTDLEAGFYDLSKEN